MVLPSLEPHPSGDLAPGPGRSRGWLGLVLALAVAAIGLLIANEQRGPGRSEDSGASIVGGHSITYLPTQPYQLTRGTGTCSTAKVRDNTACWAPTILRPQATYTASEVAGPESTQLRLVLGGPKPPETTGADDADGFTTTATTVGGRAATLRTLPTVVQLFFTLDDGTNAAVVALNIPASEIESFAAGIR